MKIALAAGAVVAVLAAPYTVLGKESDKQMWFAPKLEPIEVVGEVVDTWCYTGRVVGLGRGKAHEQCAKTCMLGGITAGILDDKGTLYIAAKTRGYIGANRALLPYVAKRVRVKGFVARTGGTQLLKIDSIEEVRSGAGTKGDSKGKPAKK